MISPFKPAPPDLTARFMESVQPVAPSIWNQIRETALNMKNALGSFGSTVFGGLTAIPKGALYGMANVIAVPSAFLNKAASTIDKTQKAVHTLLTGS
jgi:hypothetical protein